MVQPADFADHLEGSNRLDTTVWLILADLLADTGRDEEADRLRQAVLAGHIPDQLVGLDEYYIILPDGAPIILPRRPDPND